MDYRHALRVATSTAVAISCCVVLSGCGGSEESTASAKSAVPESTPIDGPVDVMGWVSDAGPVGGAKVRILDLDGDEIGAGSAPTTPSGLWHVKIEGELPSNFVVESTGGTDELGGPEGTLRHVEHGYEQGDMLAVNAATTLAAAYLDEHGDVSEADAHAVVRRYLDLPSTIDLQHDLRASNTHFSGHEFRDEIPEGTGVHEHAAALVDDMHDEQVAGFPHPLPNAPVVTSDEAAQDSAQILLAGLTGGPEGAAGALGSIVISKAFGGSDPNEAILAQLQAIRDQLDRVEKDVSDMRAQLDQVATDSKDNLYRGATAGLVQYRVPTDKLWRAYVATLDPDATPEVRQAAATSFVDQMDSGSDPLSRLGLFQDALETINDAMLGRSTKSPSTTWINYMLAGGGTGSGPVRFVAADHQDSWSTAQEEWQAMQAKILLINLAYAETTKQRSFVAQAPQWTRDFGAYDAGNLLAQRQYADLEQPLTRVPDGTRYDRATGLLWAAKVVGGDVYGGDLVETSSRYFNTAATQTGITGWDFPTIGQLRTLRDPQGGLGGPSNNAVGAYLVANGFPGWVKASDSKSWYYPPIQCGYNPGWAMNACARQVFNLNTGKAGERWGRCDGVPPKQYTCFKKYRYITAKVLPVHVPAKSERFVPKLRS